MTSTDKPLVSIFCLAYNHEAYIEKAIESWLMQKTNFRFEAVIGEDNSTDRTREIVMRYAMEYPDIIRVITSDTNVGMRANAKRTKEACRGRYMAFCEGDDYWTDPRKLQQQADFLEANPDFSICFHDAVVLWDDKSRPPSYFVPKDQKPVSTTEDVIEKWFIPTASMMLRTEYNQQLPEWFKHVYNGDWATQLILSTKGKIKYIDELMSVYRKNEGGMSGGPGRNTEFVNQKKAELLDFFNEYTHGKFEAQIKRKKSALEKETRAYLLRKNRKFLYWISNPVKTVMKISDKIKSRNAE